MTAFFRSFGMNQVHESEGRNAATHGVYFVLVVVYKLQDSKRSVGVGVGGKIN